MGKILVIVRKGTSVKQDLLPNIIEQIPNIEETCMAKGFILVNINKEGNLSTSQIKTILNRLKNENLLGILTVNFEISDKIQTALFHDYIIHSVFFENKTVKINV